MNYINVKTLKKYKGKSIAYLKEKATLHFNKWIRLRDYGKGCVSCDTGKVENAGHFHSGGSFPSLRYNENNVHGQCIHCNWPLQGNQVEYRKRITLRISTKELKELDHEVKRYRQTGYKWDRFFLIEVIEKYKDRCKHLENLNNPPF